MKTLQNQWDIEAEAKILRAQTICRKKYQNGRIMRNQGNPIMAISNQENARSYFRWMCSLRGDFNPV